MNETARILLGWLRQMTLQEHVQLVGNSALARGILRPEDLAANLPEVCTVYIQDTIASANPEHLLASQMDLTLAAGVEWGEHPPYGEDIHRALCEHFKTHSLIHYPHLAVWWSRHHPEQMPAQLSGVPLTVDAYRQGQLQRIFGSESLPWTRRLLQEMEQADDLAEVLPGLIRIYSPAQIAEDCLRCPKRMLHRHASVLSTLALLASAPELARHLAPLVIEIGARRALVRIYEDAEHRAPASALETEQIASWLRRGSRGAWSTEQIHQMLGNIPDLQPEGMGRCWNSSPTAEAELRFWLAALQPPFLQRMLRLRPTSCMLVLRHGWRQISGEQARTLLDHPECRGRVREHLRLRAGLPVLVTGKFRMELIRATLMEVGYPDCWSDALQLVLTAPDAQPYLVGFLNILAEFAYSEALQEQAILQFIRTHFSAMLARLRIELEHWDDAARSLGSAALLLSAVQPLPENLMEDLGRHLLAKPSRETDGIYPLLLILSGCEDAAQLLETLRAGVPFDR